MKREVFFFQGLCSILIQVYPNYIPTISHEISQLKAQDSISIASWRVLIFIFSEINSVQNTEVVNQPQWW